MKNATQKIVLASMFAALTCVATMIIKIPSPLSGYLNLGDCIVLLSGWLLSPVYGFLAAAIGSALADIFSGFVLYAPATFLIKGTMALCAFYIFRTFHAPVKRTFAHFASGIAAELLMVLGYYFFEVCLYGLEAPLVNIPANAVQGTAGLLMGLLLIKIFEKNHIAFFDK